MREKCNISRGQLVHLLHVAKSMIATYERDEVQPALSTTIILAHFFHGSMIVLLGKEKNNYPELDVAGRAFMRIIEKVYNEFHKLSKEKKNYKLI